MGETNYNATKEAMMEKLQFNRPVMAFDPSEHKVVIEKVTNGFIIKVGCKTFVAKTWSEVSTGICEYFDDPIAARIKYCSADSKCLKKLIKK